MIRPHLRPGYLHLEAASRLAPNSEAWVAVMRDVLQLPFSMLDAVHAAMKMQAWRHSKDPLLQVRTAAENWARRKQAEASHNARPGQDARHPVVEPAHDSISRKVA